MTCKRCGALLVEGHVYCDSCGAEVQFVPDFNELEEDILPTLVGDEADKDGKDDKKKGFLSSKRSRRMAAVAAVCVVMILGVIIHFQSYSYSFHRAKRLDRQADFETAATYYDLAIQRKETVDAYINLGNDYLLLQRFDDAEVSYRKALSLAKDGDGDPLVAYDALLTLFEETGDVEAAGILYDEISEKRIKKLLAAKFVRPPSFSEAAGVYDADLELTLTAEDGYTIYFTKDGSDPEPYFAKEYKKPIKLRGGETTVKACCVDKAGKKSMVMERTYNIDYPIPAMPTANPSGGTFHAPMRVVLSKEDDGEIYYSWNGSIPTEESSLYEGPIDIPEGNNVLSAVVIDDNGMTSDVLRCNYVYLP